MKACRGIAGDVLRVLIEDAQRCIDKEAELIVELIRRNEGQIQEAQGRRGKYRVAAKNRRDRAPVGLRKKGF